MLTMTDILSIERTLQLAIAPAFVLGGVMAVLSLLIGRLQRIGDLEIMLRDRGLEEMRLRPLLLRRSRVIYPAIACCIVSALLLCLLVMVSFIEPLFGRGTVGVHVAGLLIAAMVFLTARPGDVPVGSGALARELWRLGAESVAGALTMPPPDRRPRRAVRRGRLRRGAAGLPDGGCRRARRHRHRRGRDGNRRPARRRALLRSGRPARRAGAGAARGPFRQDGAGEGVAGEPRAGRTPLPAWHPGVRRLRRAALGARRAGRGKRARLGRLPRPRGSPTPRWRRPAAPRPAGAAVPDRLAPRTGGIALGFHRAGTAEVLDLATCEVLDPRLVGAVPGAARPRPAVAGAAPAGLGGAEPAGYGADLCCARMARSRPAKGRCWRASRGRPACPASPGRGEDGRRRSPPSSARPRSRCPA